MKFLLSFLFIFSLFAEEKVILQGNENLWYCQSKSSSSWKNHINVLHQGGDSELLFRTSWSEKYAELLTDLFDNDRSIHEGIDMLNKQRDCLALTAMMKRTFFDKTDINTPQKSRTLDKRLTCHYPNPMSQDYQACMLTVWKHDKYIVQEAKLLEKQAALYKTFSKDQLEKLKQSGAIQIEASKFGEASFQQLSQMTQKRIDLQEERIEVLSEMRDKIPTRETLSSECSEKIKANMDHGVKDFLALAKTFSPYMGDSPPLRDHCQNALGSNENDLLSNPEAISQINGIIEFEKEKLAYLRGEKDEADLQGSETGGLLSWLNAQESAFSGMSLARARDIACEENCDEEGLSKKISSLKGESLAELQRKSKGKSLNPKGRNQKGSDRSLLLKKRSSGNRIARGSLSSKRDEGETGDQFGRNLEKDESSDKNLEESNSRESRSIASVKKLKVRRYPGGFYRDENGVLRNKRGIEVRYDINQNENQDLFEIISRRYLLLKAQDRLD